MLLAQLLNEITFAVKLDLQFQVCSEIEMCNSWRAISKYFSRFGDETKRQYMAKISAFSSTMTNSLQDTEISPETFMRF